MKPTLPSLGAAFFALALLAFAPPAAFGARRHFELVRSDPVADSTVATVLAVRLWFTEAPEDNTVSIHVLDAAGEQTPVSDVSQDSEDPTMFSVAPRAALAPGTYTVAWRGMGDDGHVVRGQYEFRVAQAR